MKQKFKFIQPKSLTSSTHLQLLSMTQKKRIPKETNKLVIISSKNWYSYIEILHVHKIYEMTKIFVLILRRHSYLRRDIILETLERDTCFLFWEFLNVHNFNNHFYMTLKNVLSNNDIWIFGESRLLKLMGKSEFFFWWTSS